MTELSIDGDRLWESLQALGQIGRYLDEPSGVWGVNRLALTAADGEGRRQVVDRMRALGLTVTIDRIGNVYGRRAGREETRPVVVGSHIDSVSTAGRFDGCLGVLGGLEVVRALEAAGRQTRRPIVIAFFTDEEGSRFGTDMLGSAVATGRLGLEEAYQLRDQEGLRLRDELAKIGFLGTVEPRLDPPHAYIECHIEQGPTLRSMGRDIGVVTGVQAISWHELTLVGRSAHAGTTPMDLRSDAGVAAARVNLRLREMIASGRYGPELRATMGALVTRPGLVNIVPGRVSATVDLRHPYDGMMRRAEKDLIAYYQVVAREERVKVSWRQTARTEQVGFAASVQRRVAEAATARSLTHAQLTSGAGHDAQELARICQAGMVFVPGENDGISHNPLEYSTAEQCANGVNVLCDVVLSFADEAGA